MKRVIVSGAFDDLHFKNFRFLDEAAKLGSVEVLLWSDEAVAAATGKPPKFPLVEREYFVGAIRFAEKVTPADSSFPSAIAILAGNTEDPHPNPLPEYRAREKKGMRDGLAPSPGTPGEGRGGGSIWVVSQCDDCQANRELAKRAGAEYHVISDATLAVAPPVPATPINPISTRKKVLVTGSFDWFHSGHVRFFEECSELGDLYVVVGHDENIKLLKGEGHPLFPALQRRFITGSIRFVKLALVSTGNGWMDAEPECQKIRPDIYAVNEDGDRPEKARFCEQHGIEYRVLKRLPKEGLPKRQSTALRGF